MGVFSCFGVLSPFLLFITAGVYTLSLFTGSFGRHQFSIAHIIVNSLISLSYWQIERQIESDFEGNIGLERNTSQTMRTAMV